jgi:protein tyrosine/serine phosphatase
VWATGERHVPFDACFNFRDLGGYATIDQREVRRGVLFRSDSLHRLSTRDLAALAALRVRAVIDLRTSSELADTGRVADHDDRVFRHVPCEDPTDEYLRPRAELYLEFAQARGPQLAAAFGLVAHEPGPIVFHCMAGKDRTGILAALLLATFGVPDATIATDYELTERSVPRALTWATAHDPDWAAWLTEAAPTGRLTTPADAMGAFLQKLRAEYGTVDAYLTDAVVAPQTVAALRARSVA